MNPYIFIALAVLSAATAKILHKRVLVEGDPFVYAFFQNALSALLFAPFAFTPFAVAQSKEGWLSLSLLLCVCGALLPSQASCHTSTPSSQFALLSRSHALCGRLCLAH